MAMRVLVVDDEDTVTRMVKTHLENSKMFEAVTATSLAEAKVIVHKGGVDGVILDLLLPDAVEVQAVRELIAIKPDLPILVITGLQELLFPALSAGATDAMVKPLDPQQLLERTGACINRKRADHEARPVKESAEDVQRALQNLSDSVFQAMPAAVDVSKSDATIVAEVMEYVRRAAKKMTASAKFRLVVDMLREFRAEVDLMRAKRNL